jgi:hypothetical protein
MTMEYANPAATGAAGSLRGFADKVTLRACVRAAG